MNIRKASINYVGPIVIILLLIGFFIYSSVKESFSDCTCPTGSMLRNGGCLTCESGYRLSTDYYNAHCVSTNPNDYGSGKYIKPAVVKSVKC